MNQSKKTSNQLITLTIDGLDKKGVGKGRRDTGSTWLVPYTIPGEQVLVEKKRKKTGDLKEIMEPSPHRIAPRCRHFGLCGGCLWQHIEYDHQLQLKQERVKALFDRYHVPIDDHDLPIVPSQPFHYRNRMDFVWWYDGRFGLRQRGKWHAMEALEECWLLPEPVMQIALEINQRVQNSGLPFRDQKYGKPGLRYLVIRCGHFSHDVMVSFVSDPMHLPSSLWEGIDQISSVYQLINDNPQSDLSTGRPIHLAGEKTYCEVIENVTFHIGPTTFFQPNPAVAQEMVRFAGQCLAQRRDQTTPIHLLDLYCGIGLFSIVLSDQCEKIMGVENNEDAIHWASHNAQGRPIHFNVQDAEKLEVKDLNDLTTLLVDPPRAGIHPRVMRMILEYPFEDIIYVSCNPTNGISDIAQFSPNYSLQSVRLFDQFPQTAHVELIAHLKRK